MGDINNSKEEFSIHIRAWGAGLIVWIIGFTAVLAYSVSMWFLLLLFMLLPTIYVIWSNERANSDVK